MINILPPMTTENLQAINRIAFIFFFLISCGGGGEGGGYYDMLYCMKCCRNFETLV